MGPLNAAQALYLPWLHAKIEASMKPKRGGFVRQGTPPKRHLITDRAARKAQARDVGLQRFWHLAAGKSFASFAYQPAEAAE